MDDGELRSRLSTGAAVASERLKWPRIAAAVCDVYASVSESLTATDSVR